MGSQIRCRHLTIDAGTRFLYDGEVVEVVELAAARGGIEVVLKDGRGRVQRLFLKEVLFSDRARVLPDEPRPSALPEAMPTRSPRWSWTGSTPRERAAPPLDRSGRNT
jgi:hypothetical protein